MNGETGEIADRVLEEEWLRYCGVQHSSLTAAHDSCYEQIFIFFSNRKVQQFNFTHLYFHAYRVATIQHVSFTLRPLGAVATVVGVPVVRPLLTTAPHCSFAIFKKAPAFIKEKSL